MNLTGQWAREKVGITDPAKAPNHAFRHRMEDELRAADVAEDVRDAILGAREEDHGDALRVPWEALRRLADGVRGCRCPDASRAQMRPDLTRGATRWCSLP